ncbi:unnamed protein product [Adineta ricciae]|uniref:Adenosine 3'-phospho 5'-phosphosulfate transporter 2 n=1 Tax=Adineta ricciae TaxID=249248 RepID=A0A814MAZ3_ADIRI|nr:unnamed protein product [Adineta ricciae]
MAINQGFDSLSSDSSIKALTLSTDSIVPREHDQMLHSPSKSSLWHRYSSLPNQYPLRFLGLCAQVFVYYLGYGYLQELIFTLKGFSETAWFLTCYQFLVYSVLSFRHIGFVGLSQRRASFRSYIILAMLTLSTMGLSNYSVGYLNYPTQVMFKCCKLIPVLIGGVIIQKKTFNRYDVSAAICMSIGLIFFTLADSKVRPSFNTYGVFIICMALVADAIIGNYQEKIMKTHNVPNVEMVFYSFMFGFLMILFGLLLTDNLFSSIAFWSKYPVQTYGYALLFSVFGYLGIDIVLTLIKEYGALICVTVTTCRKAVTIVLSFILFSKPFIFDYVWSGFIVVVGIYLNVYSRNQAAFNAKIASYATSLFGSHWVSKFYSGTSTRTLSV